MLELAAGAQPLHLQAVQEEGEAERVTPVPPRSELERFCFGLFFWGFFPQKMETETSHSSAPDVRVGGVGGGRYH